MISQEEFLKLVRDNPLPVAALTVAAAVLLPLLASYLMGAGASSARGGKKKPFLEPTEYKPLPLTVKEFITHNTVRLRFELPDPQQRLGLPIGQHISFSAKGPDGKDVIRSYTPVSDDDLLGAVEFVVKIYPTGKMSQVLNALQVGQTMLMRGPKVRLRRGGGGAWEEGRDERGAFEDTRAARAQQLLRPSGVQLACERRGDSSTSQT